MRNKKIMYFLLCILGMAGIIDTLVLCFYANLNLGILLPGIIGVLINFYVIIKIRYRRNKPLVSNVLLRGMLYFLTTILIVSFVLIEGLMIKNSFSQEDIKTDYVIILGASVKGETVSLTLAERLDKGVEYLNKYSEAKVVVSGGQGPGENIPESEAMKRYLVSKGISENRVIQENKSTSTMENFAFSKDILKRIENKDITNIMVITNDFHMMRAKMLARRNGFSPYGLSCSTPAPVRLNNYMREYFAVIKSFLLDR